LITPVISREECRSWSPLLFILLHAPVSLSVCYFKSNLHCLAYICSVSCECACARVSDKSYTEVI
jgi:hypothetical protein